jgi:predicted lipoprotein with Yx(FWY)xxD motif
MPRTTRSLLALTLGLAGLLASCGSSGGSGRSGATTTTRPAATTTTSAGPPVVMVLTTKLGPTLVDARGHTLYEYDADPDKQVTCTEACAFLWPPLTVTQDRVPVGPGLDASLFTALGSVNGRRSVAVNNRPLYRFSQDKQPGQIGGVAAGTGLWHALTPNGTPYPAG